MEFLVVKWSTKYGKVMGFKKGSVVEGHTLIWRGILLLRSRVGTGASLANAPSRPWKMAEAASIQSHYGRQVVRATAVDPVHGNTRLLFVPVVVRSAAARILQALARP